MDDSDNDAQEGETEEAPTHTFDDDSEDDTADSQQVESCPGLETDGVRRRPPDTTRRRRPPPQHSPPPTRRNNERSYGTEGIEPLLPIYSVSNLETATLGISTEYDLNKTFYLHRYRPFSYAQYEYSHY